MYGGLLDADGKGRFARPGHVAFLLGDREIDGNGHNILERLADPIRAFIYHWLVQAMRLPINFPIVP